MKYEWKKCEKVVYGGKVPTFMQVPSQTFITIQGKGNPNCEDFANRVSALYAMAFGIKMDYKKMLQKSEDAQAITDYAVYPLEGVWSGGKQGEVLVKEDLEYTIMIKQPDFITEEMFQKAYAKVKQKKFSVYLDEISFQIWPAERCVQVLHIGAFDDEPASFAKLDAFISKHGLSRAGDTHREIYLNNANRTSKDKLKTILRYAV